MGGRGSNSSVGPKAISIKIGNTTLTYRDRGNGKITGLNDMNINNNAKGKSIADLENMAKKAGYQYTTYSRRQLVELDKKYNTDREKASEQLNDLWFRAAPKKRKGWKGH